MSRLYKGEKPCPGCGRPGTEVARSGMDCLCEDCKHALKIGKAFIKEKNLDQNNYKLEDLRFAEISLYRLGINEIEFALVDLLQKFSPLGIEYATHKGYWKENMLVGEATGATHQIALPAEVFESAKTLTQKLKDVCWQLKTDRDNYQKELDEQLRNQKNDIFNEGVAYGRNLLKQLNNGEISLRDLEAEIKRY